MCREKPRQETLDMPGQLARAALIPRGGSPASGTIFHGACCAACPSVPGDPCVSFQKTHLLVLRLFYWSWTKIFLLAPYPFVTGLL